MKVLRELSREEKTEFERIGANSKMLREYLETSLENAKVGLMNVSDDGDFRHLQGQAQVLKILLEAITYGKR